MQEVNNIETQQHTTSFVQESNKVETTQTNLNTDKPKQNSFLITLLSILLLLACSIAGFFAYQTQTLVKELTALKSTTEPTPTATSLPTEIPTATESGVVTGTEDWKTYEGKIFSFKYPKEMSIKRQDIQDSENASNVGDMVIVSDNKYKLQVSSDFLGGWGGNPCLKIVNKNIADKESQVLYFGKSVDGTDKCTEKYEGLVALIGNGFEHPYPIIIDLQRQEGVEFVDLDLFNQVLSTFKFTN